MYIMKIAMRKEVKSPAPICALAIRLAPTVAAEKVYFGSDDGRVYCLDAETGELVWTLRASPEEDWLLARGEMISRWPIRTGVLIDEGVAYFGAG